MKLNPQQGPLYGKCIITVQLTDEELAADEEGVDYFLLFAGSTRRHLTSTLRSSHDTLQAVCPAHDCCEGVLVTLCSVSRILPSAPEDWGPGRVSSLAEHRFSFVQDLAFDMAQFLVSTAGRPDALDGVLLLDECQIPLQECERLDESLALALHHLTLPPGWTLLGNDLSNCIDWTPQETLLHFSARRGLLRVTHFLLQQPGATEALGLANRQGHTPSAIAASRGHTRLHELLTEAVTELESGSIHRVFTDARVESHLPTLNTHSLTLKTLPDHKVPTLQKSVEQLLHLIEHLHAKRVSVLELQSHHLHTADECCDGAEKETCAEELHQCTAVSTCSVVTSEDIGAQDYLVESRGTDSGHDQSENPENESGLPVRVCPKECGLGFPEEETCFSSNTQRDYCQTEEKGGEQPVVSTQNLCHKSEGAQSAAERARLTVGILPPTGCGKQAEETDREEGVIWEGQEATKGEDRSEQEEELSPARRSVEEEEKEEEEEEEFDSESTELITPCRDTNALVMGQSSSLEGLELPDSTDSEMRDCSQEEETIKTEEIKLCEELCGRPRVDEKNENEGLTDPVAPSGDHPSTPMTDCGDVIEQPESASSCLLIEGLHEGEPPPDINSLEQNQETAGKDYATEQQGLAPETDSENCTGTVNGKELDVQDIAPPFGYSIENSTLLVVEPNDTADAGTTGDSAEDAWTCQADCEQSAEIMPNFSFSLADLEPCLIHRHSSDEDASFQSAGSSTTELFHLTEDNFTVQEPDLIQTETAQRSSAESLMTQPNYIKQGDGEVCSLSANAGILLETGAVTAVTKMDITQTGSDPDLHLSSSPQTVEDLNFEETEEKLVSKLSSEDTSIDHVQSETVDDTDMNQSIVDFVSEVTGGVLCELHHSIKEEAILVKDDFSSGETDNKSVAASEEDSKLEPDPQKCDHLEMAAAERSPNRNLRHLGSQIDIPSSQNITHLSDSAEVEGFIPNNEATGERLIENNMTEKTEKQDIVDGARENHISAKQEVDVIESEDAIIAPRVDENHRAEETDFSTIHRDKEASFHQPCNSLHSGSPQSSAFPSLPSRTSSSTSCPSTSHRDSGCDIESFLSTDTGYDSVFRKNDEPVTGGDSTSEVSVSCSSTDDAASVGPPSSSPESTQGLGCSWSPEEGIQTGAATPAGLEGGEGGAGDAEEEAKDRVTEVPRRSRLLRNTIRSLSPLRRHSWGPGKNNAGDAEMNQRSSIRSPGEGKTTFHRRSYSLEGLSGVQELRGPISQGPQVMEPLRMPRHDSDDRGSLVSLTEEQEDLEEHGGLHDLKSSRYRPRRNNSSSMTLPLTKSVSMLAISQRDIDAMGLLRRKGRISFSSILSPILTKSKSQFIHADSSSSDDDDNISMRSFCSTSGSLAYSISEEEPGPLRPDTEEKNLTKVSRTFSYLKNKMYKKTREKERDKKEKDKEAKEKDKKTVNGHVFTSVSLGLAAQCSQCNKAFSGKEAFHCSYCNSSVHKSCRDSLPSCAKVKMKLPKQQFAVPDSSSFPPVTMRNKSGGTRERPWSAILSPEDHSSLTIPCSRRPTSIMAFHGNNLSKSLSISNIAGPVFDEMPIKGLRYLSQSTDSLNRTNQVTESMESLTDEGTEMIDGQLMGEFEAEAKELEADSWSLCMEQQYLQQLDRELVKRQDVIYELMQTEIHHIRTLRIMSEVYSKGLQKEMQLELQTVEKLFPALDELLDFHTQHLLRLLERKRECLLEGGSLDGAFIINRIGDLLISQFSGSNGESMKRIYGRFCSRHNEAVNFYKDLLTKDKRFKAFIKKKMSSSIVRRLGIPECILLVTQRITKYPVLIQRMLQHTKESEEDHEDLTESIRLVKEVIAAVDSKVNEHEKRRRLKDIHIRMDSKSIMMMKNGQIFAREDLLRRRLIHDGTLQLKNTQGRLKDVHAMLLSDVFVFLQEKDQKYVFAMLDQRSTVISLQKLIIREVANEERGLFLITAGIEKPEMIEVLASSKDERNTWMQLIQDAMQSMDKDEDEGIPSETEDDKRQLETKAKEMRDLLRQKDTEIMSLLEEKVRLFRGMWEGLSPSAEACQSVEPFFRSACSLEPARGASIMNDALQEVEKLQALVNGSLGGAMASAQEGIGGGGGGGLGPVSLPRRAETFGGFDSHQMHFSKSGDRDESEDSAGDLRRTESDSVLKKGGNANLLMLLKRNSEQVLHSVSNLHLLLSTLQAVVVQQDSFIEEQRQALSERSASCTSLSRQPSRPSSLIEQEKQRSLEKQRQELASLQRQQAAHAEEKRRREREWEVREQQMTEREVLVHLQTEEIVQQQKKLGVERQELQSRKEEYQKDLERLRDAQRKLERDREAVQRQLDRMEELRFVERTPSTTSEESQFPGSSQSLEPDPLELSSSSSSSSLPGLLPTPPQQSKPKGKSLNPFTLSSSGANLKGSDANNQISRSLLQLAKSKSKEAKKEKKKQKGKAGSPQTADLPHRQEPPLDGEIFFC